MLTQTAHRHKTNTNNCIVRQNTCSDVSRSLLRWSSISFSLILLFEWLLYPTLYSVYEADTALHIGFWWPTSCANFILWFSGHIPKEYSPAVSSTSWHHAQRVPEWRGGARRSLPQASCSVACCGVASRTRDDEETPVCPSFTEVRVFSPVL